MLRLVGQDEDRIRRASAIRFAFKPDGTAATADVYIDGDWLPIGPRKFEARLTESGSAEATIETEDGSVIRIGAT